MSDVTLSDHFKIVLADLRDQGVSVGDPDAANGNVVPLAKVCESYGIDMEELLSLVTHFEQQAQQDIIRLAMSRQGLELDTVLRGIMAQCLLTGWRARGHAG